MSQRLNSHSIKNIGMEQSSLMGKYSHFLMKMAQVFRHGPSATSTSSKMHLVCPLNPPPQKKKKKKNCISIVFNFFWGREESILPWNPGGGGGSSKVTWNLTLKKGTVSLSKLLNWLWSWVWIQQAQSFSGPKHYRDFQETGPRWHPDSQRYYSSFNKKLSDILWKKTLNSS